MKTYTCQDCGNDYTEKQLEPETFAEGDYFCITCFNNLAEEARDFVDPGHNFDSFEDWNENGH